MSEGIVNILELVFLILHTLVRVAGTVALVWIVVTKLEYDFGTFWLLVLIVLVGMGFTVKYDNPYVSKAKHEQVQQTEPVKETK